MSVIEKKTSRPLSQPKLNESLHECLRDLTSTQRIAIQMRFWEQLEIAQIASVLEMSWDEIDQLLKNTLHQLRQMLEKRISPSEIKFAA